MDKIFLYNTLSRKKEEFKSIIKEQVGIYTCGPTVYDFAHIGNLRTYLFEDFLVRTLLYNGYKIKRVMNITDVGHLSGDMDMGEDKMEKGAAREGKNAWEIADFYTESFKNDLRSLNILEPSIWCKATDSISEQINLIQVLEEKGFTYKTSDGLYFNTAKFKDYNKLSHLPLKDLKEGARVEKNPEKINPTDFALWKFSPSNSNRQMEWESPWGKGFPGWHLECSAMSLKELGKQLDIHCGGIDHINVHHTNEIAQSEAATNNKFFNYWLHGAFLNIYGGKKMAKSDGNFLTLKNAIIDKNINPLAYRFASLQVHYRKPMEYAEDLLLQADLGLESLNKQVLSLLENNDQKKTGKVNKDSKSLFLKAINDDLNMPQALAVLFSVFKADLSVADKLTTIFDFDKVLGLSLDKLKIDKDFDVPKEVNNLILRRLTARENKDWAMSDKLREDIESAGYLIEDIKDGEKMFRLKKK